MPPAKAKKPLLSSVALIASLGLLAYAGKRAGEQLARSSSPQPAPAAQASPSPDADSRKDRAASTTTRPDLVATSIRQLKSLAANSPFLQVDWETQAQIDAIIAKLSAAELAEVFASLDLGTNRELWPLAFKVGAAWMAKDPDAAMKAAMAKPDFSGGQLVRSMFSTWAHDEPAAALAWLDAGKLPEDQAKLVRELRSDALRDLAERDFALASAEFLKLESPADGTRDEVANPMTYWGETYVDDPAMRDRLVEFAKSTGRPRDYAELNKALVKNWPQSDSVGMMNYLVDLRRFLESDAVPATSRPDVDGSAVAIAIFREYDGPALEWWMERYGESRDVPSDLRQAMGGWSQKYPDAVLKWFEEQPPSPQRDALAATVVPSFIQQGKFTEAADSIATIQDPAYRQSAIERLDFIWKEKDPAAAATWRATLTPGQ